MAITPPCHVKVPWDVSRKKRRSWTNPRYFWTWLMYINLSMLGIQCTLSATWMHHIPFVTERECRESVINARCLDMTWSQYSFKLGTLDGTNSIEIRVNIYGTKWNRKGRWGSNSSIGLSIWNKRKMWRVNMRPKHEWRGATKQQVWWWWRWWAFRLLPSRSGGSQYTMYVVFTFPSGKKGENKISSF